MSPMPKDKEALRRALDEAEAVSGSFAETREATPEETAGVEEILSEIAALRERNRARSTAGKKPPGAG